MGFKIKESLQCTNSCLILWQAFKKRTKKVYFNFLLLFWIKRPSSHFAVSCQRHSIAHPAHKLACMHTWSCPKQSLTPRRLLLATPSDIYLYVHSAIPTNTDSTATLTRSHHAHTNTLGDNALLWGYRWLEAAKHFYFLF